MENIVDTTHHYESYIDANANVHTVGEAMNDVLESLTYLQYEDGIKGIPCGFPEIDKVTNGWSPGELIVIAGGPCCGKTTLALNMIRFAAVEKKIPVFLISMELSAEEIGRKLILSESGLSSKKIDGASKVEDYEWEQLEYRLKEISKSPIFIDDTSRLNTEDIGAKIQNAIKNSGVRLVVIDTFNVITAAPEYMGTNREYEMTNISLELKRIARELNIPIIVTARFSRGHAQRGTGKPVLSDIRDTGSLEYDADRILLIHNPEYLGLSENPEDRERATVIIAKNRMGDTYDVDLLFKRHQCRFVELDESLAPFPSAANSAMNEEFDSGVNDFI